MRLNDADYAQLNGIIKKQTAKYGTQLYHYTSMQTFINMITSRQLWLCSTDTMNDKKETLHFVELIEKELSGYDKCQFFSKLYGMIPQKYKYAFCLSTDRDDAAQWERYGDSAMGVCLAFNVAELCKCIYEYPDIMINPVFYSDEVQEEQYFALVKKYLETGEKDVYSSEEELMNQLIYAGNLHKHKSFKNEHEVRITTLDNKQQMGTEYKLKQIGKTVKRVLILEPDVMGKKEDARFATSFESLIDEVIIGPRSQQNIAILKEYISSNGMYEMEKFVVQSDCPLR